MKKTISTLAIASTLSWSLALTCSDLPQNLSKGSNVHSVLTLQSFLYDKHLLKVKPNGYYGPSTIAAVKAYQKSKGLTASGQVLTQTRSSIKTDSCTTTLTKKKSHGDDDENEGGDEHEKSDRGTLPILPPTPIPTPVSNQVPTSTGTTYTDTVSYDTPSGSPETIHVTLSLQNGVISQAGMTYDGPISSTSGRYLASFKASLASSGIIGKKLSDVSLSRVGGASLTTRAFMVAIGDITKKA